MRIKIEQYNAKETDARTHHVIFPLQAQLSNAWYHHKEADSHNPIPITPTLKIIISKRKKYFNACYQHYDFLAFSMTVSHRLSISEVMPAG